MGERGNNLYRQLDKYVGIPVSAMLGLYKRVFTRPSLIKIPEDARIGILCVGAIGDLLLASGLMDGLRKKLPQARIEIITSHANAEASRLLPYINSTVSFKITDFANIIRYIRTKSFDLFFDTTQWARIGNIITNLSKAKLTIGFKTSGQYRSFGYDIKVSHSHQVHEVKNFLNLGKAVWPDFNGTPHLNITRTSDNLNPQKNIYMHMWCANGKFGYLRRWPEEYWAELALYLLKKEFIINFTGSDKDYENTERFIKKFDLRRTGINNLSGQFSLSDLARLFQESSGVISINTGTMHLAALVNAKVIDLNGPTNINRWGAWGENTISLTPLSGEQGYLNLGFEFPSNPVPVMQNLPVDEVIKAMKTLKII